MNAARHKFAHKFTIAICFVLFFAHLLLGAAIPAPNGFVGFLIFYCVLFPIGYAIAVLGEVGTGDPQLPADFRQRLLERSDADLYQMLQDMTTRAGDYLSGASDVVKSELARRNLGLEQVTQLEADIAARRVEQESDASERLGWPVCIVMLAAGFAIPLSAIVPAMYSIRGHKQKAKQCYKMMGFSLLLWLGVFIVWAVKA